MPKKDTEFIQITMNRETRSVILKFIKVMQAEVWNTTEPIVSKARAGNAVNELIEFFERLNIEQDHCQLKVKFYDEIRWLFHLSNLQRDTETFLTPEEDDIFYAFMDECADQIT